MIAPDPSAAESSLRQSISAASVVTVYAGAMRYTVAPLLDVPLPTWFDSIGGTIQTAIAHASSWMDDLCIDVTSAIPQSIISFAAVFDSTSEALGNLETEILMAGGVATADQKQQALDAMGLLQDGLAAASTSLDAIDTRLLALSNHLQADHDALQQARATINANIPSGGTISKSIQADLGNDFLAITPNGPCMVSITIKTDVQLKIQQTAGSHVELLPFVLGGKLVAKAIGDNEQATSAMSQVRALWALMTGLAGDAAKDIDQASDPEVLPVLQKAEFAAARDVWNNLSDVASTLGSSSTQASLSS